MPFLQISTRWYWYDSNIVSSLHSAVQTMQYTIYTYFWNVKLWRALVKQLNIWISFWTWNQMSISFSILFIGRSLVFFWIFFCSLLFPQCRIICDAFFCLLSFFFLSRFFCPTCLYSILVYTIIINLCCKGIAQR